LRRATAAILALATGLAACAADPELRAPDRATLLAARQALVEAAERGPVPLELYRPPASLPPGRIAELAAEGVPALRPRFEPIEAEGGTRLRLLFGEPQPDLATACGPLEAGEPAAPPVALAAVLCQGGFAVAMVQGRAAGPDLADTERLIWRSTARLFPDDYPETYGFNLFGTRLSIGLGASFGF
jgi:hypothetical protein